jgi:phosphate transport system permease protein
MRRSSRPAGVDAGVSKLGDKVFGGLSKGAGILILIVLAAVAAFLIAQAIPTFTTDDSTSRSAVRRAADLRHDLGRFLALVIATPLAVGVALFTSHYAPRGLAARSGGSSTSSPPCRASCTACGARASSPRCWPAACTRGWRTTSASSRLFKGPASTSGRTMMTVALVLAVMILPIITAISREVFLQTPRLHEEASLALGATRWEMIRQSVLPVRRSGCDQLARCSASAGARRDDGRRHHPVAGEHHHVQHHQQPEPEHDRRQHRPQVPRVGGQDVNRLIATGLVPVPADVQSSTPLARRIARAGFSGADG